MNKKKDTYIDWTLIKRVTNGIATAEEQEQYDRWISSNKDHEKFIDNTNKYYTNTKSFSPLSPEMLIKKREMLVNSHNRKKSLKFKRISIAAIFIAASFVASYTFIGNKGVSDVVSNNSLNIKKINEKSLNLGVGDDVVTLKTSSGQTFDLEDGRLVSSAKSLSVEEKGINYVANEVGIEIVNSDIEYHTLQVPKGRDWKVTLSDSTIIYLNSNSELKYPNRFVKGEKRVVYLTGEAYFDVVKNDNSQFIVKTEDVNVAVYGTEFNVNTYIDNVVETILINGSVAVVDSLHNKTIFLEPKQKATCNGGNIEVETVDLDSEILWMKNILLFNNIEMSRIIEILSNYHNIDVAFDNEEIKKIKIYCKIPKDTPLENILDAISRSGKISYKLDGTKLLLW